MLRIVWVDDVIKPIRGKDYKVPFACRQYIPPQQYIFSSLKQILLSHMNPFT